MTLKEMSIQEIEERINQIGVEIDGEGADLDALEEEMRNAKAELELRKADEAHKAEIRKAVANMEGTKIEPVVTKANPIEERANKLKETNRMSLDTLETRSLLVSGSTVATPTGVSGINDTLSSGHSILDYVKVVDCQGMGANKVAYVAADLAAASSQTEGSAATSGDATFGYVTITPDSVAVYSQISKQVKKQSPLNYEQKVSQQVMGSLRKACVNKIVASLKASSLVATTKGTIVSNKGVIDATTLRTIALAYGGSNDVAGNAMLFLNKNDLIAFGDVRGTNEKRAVYDIEVDGSNPNVGIIRDGGLAVKYCICSGLDAYNGTTRGTSAKPTMFYGNPQCFEFDLFSGTEIKISEDFAITSLMDTIVGDCEVGGDVVVQGGFVTLQLTASGS